MRESVEQILAAYQAIGLTARRRGLEWHGPCPVCGGKDRWYVGPSAGGGSVMACRQCRDFRAIAGALGLNGRPPGELDTAAVERAEAERDSRHADAARRAVAIFARCRPRRHQYLRGKGFPDVKLPAHEGRIVVPVWGSAGLQSLQFIGRARKRFLTWRPDGGRSSGYRAVRPTRAPVARRGVGDRPFRSPRSRCARRAGLRHYLLLGGRADGCAGTAGGR